jgi:hypothetical protein
MYSLIGYFVKPQGIYSFLTKAPTFLASTSPFFVSLRSISLGILLISISFKWTGNFDKHRQHSYFVLAAALVEYLGFVLKPFLLFTVSLALRVGKLGSLELTYRNMWAQGMEILFLICQINNPVPAHVRAYIPVNINHQSARTSSFILSVFGTI